MSTTWTRGDAPPPTGTTVAFTIVLSHATYASSLPHRTGAHRYTNDRLSFSWATKNAPGGTVHTGWLGFSFELPRVLEWSFARSFSISPAENAGTAEPDAIRTTV